MNEANNQQRNITINIIVNQNQNGIGNTKFICANKRICGKEIWCLIGTYMLIIVPTLVYAIIM